MIAQRLLLLGSGLARQTTLPIAPDPVLHGLGVVVRVAVEHEIDAQGIVEIVGVAARLADLLLQA